MPDATNSAAAFGVKTWWTVTLIQMKYRREIWNIPLPLLCPSQLLVQEPQGKKNMTYIALYAAHFWIPVPSAYVLAREESVRRERFERGTSEGTWSSDKLGLAQNSWLLVPHSLEDVVNTIQIWLGPRISISSLVHASHSQRDEILPPSRQWRTSGTYSCVLRMNAYNFKNRLTIHSFYFCVRSRKGILCPLKILGSFSLFARKT